MAFYKTIAHDRIEAAFVVIYDYAFANPDLNIPYALVDLVVYAMRKQFPLSREEAQAILRNPEELHRVAAALVLAYEGIGARRSDVNYSFSLDDLEWMHSERARIKLSARRALGILSAGGL